MSNIFTEASSDLVKAGSFLLGVSEKALKIFNSSKPAEEAAVKLLASVEALIALAAPAVSSAGVNFAADSAAYAQFLTVVADAKAFAVAAESVIKSL